MARMNHSNPYKKPGSGGARRRPIGGGADWVPLPEGTWQNVETCTTTEVPRNGPIGKVMDHFLPPKTETTCTTEIRKKYF